jgi:hypothetical protein
MKFFSIDSGASSALPSRPASPITELTPERIRLKPAPMIGMALPQAAAMAAPSACAAVVAALSEPVMNRLPLPLVCAKEDSRQNGNRVRAMKRRR